VITREDLQAAIAECQGKRNPDASTCIKLAAFYTIKDYMYPEHKEDPKTQLSYSYDLSPDTGVYLDSNTEFSEAINGKNQKDVLSIIDEAMTAFKVLNPRFYASIIRKLNEL